MSSTLLSPAYQQGHLTKADYVHQMHTSLHRHLFAYPALLQACDLAEIRLTPEGVVFIQRDTGLQFTCSPTDERAMPIDVLNFGRYEPAELAAVHRLVKDGDTVIDIGANIGWYSLGLLERFPSVRVAAFEPVPGTRALLERNIALNTPALNAKSPLELKDRLVVVPCALSHPGAPSEMTMFVAPDCGVNASLKNVANRANAETVACRVTTLDRWLSEEAPEAIRQRVNYIKCDVEGAEWLVVQGAEQVLKTHRPILQLELLRKWSEPYGYHPNTVIEYLNTLNYRCHTLDEAGDLMPFDRVDDATVATNYFFLPA
jgi:FkbM family methyltransferase